MSVTISITHTDCYVHCILLILNADRSH